ncbi:NADH-quinone oxidoreductase subunit C [Streptomyces sp. NPDC058867]|uniref:NADH-quinone oxidoreductase subunit C n=1 Tax=unclassified Streptomyces TaxID=2593676 RepID=UPI0036825306
MTTIGWLPAPAEELFGTGATAEESYEVLTVDVPPASWTAALRTARDELGCTYFDWLSAVDEPGTGFRVAAHVAALAPVRRLLLRTTVPHEAPVLESAVTVFAGAAWHERETHEMFGVTFEGHPGLDHLLLPETFEGHPLRKDFVLAARVAKAWPGAKEPGESDHGGPKRRQMLPPGVPDPNEWGPLKGQLPAAPARPARGAGRAAGERPARGTAAGDRPVRRTRSVTEGSASQSAATEAAEAAAPEVAPAAPAAEGAPAAASPRRSRSAGEGSASQRAGTPEGGTAGPADTGPGTDAPAGTGTGPGTAAPAATGAESSTAAPAATRPEPGTGTGGRPVRRSRSVSEGSASQRTRPAAAEDSSAAPRAPRSSDAPWHHARPAFEESEAAPEAPDAAPKPAPETPETPEESGAEAPAGPDAETPAGPDAETPEEPGADAPAESSGEARPEDPDNPAGGPR